MKAWKHILISVGALFLLLGVPFLRTGYAQSLLSGGADVVSSASVILDTPSGNYVVLINKNFHTNEETLATWEDFFAGKEIDYIFEDISCAVASGDGNGQTMAESYQSRLPENQMKLRQEDGTLLLSKAEHGKFDVIVLSKEFADASLASTAYGDSVAVIEVKGAVE